LIRFGALKLTLVRPVADIASKIDVAFVLIVSTLTIARAPLFEQAIARFKFI
jgi:hypothetical protein